MTKGSALLQAKDHSLEASDFAAVVTGETLAVNVLGLVMEGMVGL